MKEKNMGHQIEHGCYDCAHNAAQTHDRFYCLICRYQKCPCEGCDICLSIPTRWEQGRFDTSIFKNFEELKAAVVKHAVKEYRQRRKKYRKEHSPYDREYMLAIEKWFRSGRCSKFTDLDGDMIMDRVQAEH